MNPELPGDPPGGRKTKFQVSIKNFGKQKTRKKNVKKREVSVFPQRVCSFSHCVFFRFFAPPGARRAFSRRRRPFEHFHSVFLSISHVASKKRARAKREKTSIPNLSKSSNGGNAPSGLLGFAGAPRRAPGERVLSAPRVLLECSMPFPHFHVFHEAK